MNRKLESNAALKAQLDAVSSGAATSAGAQDWYARLAKFLQEVKAGVPAKLQDADFLRRLWDENPVAATGMGSVKMAPALQDTDFKAWFATEVARQLPSEPAEAEAQLTALYNGLRDRLKVLCGRTPRLKVIHTGSAEVELPHAAQLGQQDHVQTVLHARGLPISQPPPARHATAAAQLLGQVLPRDARAQDKQDAAQGPLVIHPGPTAFDRPRRRLRHQGLQVLPQRCADFFVSHRSSTIPGPLAMTAFC